MKLVYFTFLFVATFFIFSQLVTAQAQLTAGTTPDSFLYGLDVALDKINLLLTFDNKAKAQKGLLIARERLMEVREMTLQNKLDAAQRAEREHRDFIGTVETAVRNIERTNSTEEIEDEIEIERELEEYEKEFETVRNELKVKIEIKGEITPQQRELVDSILNSMQNRTGEVKIEIDNKKGETKIKIRQQTGRSEDEIEDEIKRIEERRNITSIRMEKALDKIQDANEEIAELREKLSGVNATQVNMTAVNVLLAQAELHLSRAQTAFNETKYGEAFGQAVSADRLVENAERMFERLTEVEEEREIEVEIEKGVAKVEVEIAGMKMKYRLNTSDKSEIVADIESRTGLTTTEIEKIMKIETEEEEKIEEKIVERQETESVEKELIMTASNFKFEPSTITVNKGEKVELKITNTGGTHTFVIDEYGINKRLTSGRTTTVEFTADKNGTFKFYCDVDAHKSLGMEGQLVVQ